MCVFITAVPITKLFAWGDSEGDSGGQVLREMTSRGLCSGACRGDNVTALNMEVAPQLSCFGRRESDFALQGLVECITLETKRVLMVVLR